MTNASFGGQRRVPHAVFCDGRTQWVVGPQTTSSGGSERSVTLMYTSDLELACIQLVCQLQFHYIRHYFNHIRLQQIT